MDIKAGDVITAQQMVGQDGLKLSEEAEKKGLAFSAKPIHIIEAHLYHVGDASTADGDGVHFHMFPIITEENGKIVLESAFGGAQEDKVICTEVYVESL